MRYTAGQQHHLQHAMLLALLGSFLLHGMLLVSLHSSSEQKISAENGSGPLHIEMIKSPAQPALASSANQSTDPEEMLPDVLFQDLPPPAAGIREKQDGIKPEPETHKQIQKRVVAATPPPHPQPQSVDRPQPKRPIKPQPKVVKDQSPEAVQPAVSKLPEIASNTVPSTSESAVAAIEPTSTTPDRLPEDREAIKTETRQQVKRWLEQQINKRFSYPKLAQRRNLEGTVLIFLVVETDGRIEGLAISDSSGHGVLDRNALTTLQKIKQVRLDTPLLLSQAMELTLPVIYQLHKG
ncbi:MAG: TonB family protein [Sedimenticola sp.]